MLRGFNKLITVAQPADHDREKVIYPRSYKTDENNPNKRTWTVEKAREYEPLAAGFGRYILEGTCAYLEVSEEGWERCGVYENRPKVCQDFEMGGEKCRLMRSLRGVDEPSEELMRATELIWQAIDAASGAS